MMQAWFRWISWCRFYFGAVTKYQVHSPFVFSFITDVLEAQHRYYAFPEIELLREKARGQVQSITVTDWRAGPGGKYEGNTTPTQRTTTLSQIIQYASSSQKQGQRLFRLVQWLKSSQILEMGTNAGIGTLYLTKSAGSKAKVISLEGCPQLADIARAHLDILNCQNVEVVTGPFEQTLGPALLQLTAPGLIFFDGNHQEAPTLNYWEICLQNANADTVFVFDDVHWSRGMESAWEKIKAHDRVRLTIDCGDFACAFLQHDIKEKQHFRIVPSRLKPWKVF